MTIDVDQQRRIGAVEPVDRLCRVADEEQVTTGADEQLEQVVLHGVEVLRLVDEDVTEAPAHDLGERWVGRQLAPEHEQQVVEVDDAATALDRLVVGEHLGDRWRRNGDSDGRRCEPH